MKYICDTNFILRYLLADNKEMFSKVKEIFDKAKTGDINLIVEQIVFTEVVFVLSSFYKVPRFCEGKIYRNHINIATKFRNPIKL